ncbi:MAG TPA: hypothetical protein VFG54_20040 [Prolixibacteraceae bacterium]|nr:hypothetical protein [Prolixibacteraceae bacterium]
MTIIRFTQISRGRFYALHRPRFKRFKVNTILKVIGGNLSTIQPSPISTPFNHS